MSHPLFTDLPSARLYVAYRNIAKMIRGTSEWKKEQFGKEVWGFFTWFLPGHSFGLAGPGMGGQHAAGVARSRLGGRWPRHLHTDRRQS